jgi:acetyl/propionyl-CoA carboxylase alpha subunit
MIKANAGGGDHGIHLSNELLEFVKLLLQDKSEAIIDFGNDGIYCNIPLLHTE